MGRPRRRRPALPDHDPRAKRSALRRNLYADGDARILLDDVDFLLVDQSTAIRSEPGPAIEVRMNGVSTVSDLGWAPLPVARLWNPFASLRDHDGSRDAYLATCSGGIIECGDHRVRVDVAGRYVRWNSSDGEIEGPLVFDRATYRERLEHALLLAQATEDCATTCVREVLERAPWSSASERGLEVVSVRLESDEHLVLVFRDPFWRTSVTARLRWVAHEPANSVHRVVRQIASWDTDDWLVSWRSDGAAARANPPYPPSWRPE